MKEKKKIIITIIIKIPATRDVSRLRPLGPLLLLSMLPSLFRHVEWLFVDVVDVVVELAVTIIGCTVKHAT